MELPAATTWGRADSLADHFARHGGDFGAATEGQYAEKASGFFQQGLRGGSAYAHLMEHVVERLRPEDVRDVSLYFESLWPEPAGAR